MQYDAYIFLGPIGLVICKNFKAALTSKRPSSKTAALVFGIGFPQACAFRAIPRHCTQAVPPSNMQLPRTLQLPCRKFPQTVLYDVEALADSHLFLQLTIYNLDSHVRPPARIWLVGA